MKSNIAIFLILALAAMLCLSAVAVAQEGKPVERERAGRGHGHGHGKKFLEAVDATEEQTEQLKEVQEYRHEALEEWRGNYGEQMKQARQALREARKSGDDEAATAAMKKLQEGMKAREQIAKNVEEKLSGILDDEQMVEARKFVYREIVEHRPQGHLARMHRRAEELDMSSEQKAQAAEILREAHQQALEADDFEQMQEIMREARTKIHNDVLNEAQRSELPGQKYRERMQDIAEELGLSEEQKEQCGDILRDAHEEARQADSPEERREIMQAARKKIHDEVLTDEQREKAEEMRREHGLNLSDEQKEKAQEIFAEAREAMQDADSHRQMRQIMKSAHERFQAILTAEQKIKLREWRERGGGPRRGEHGPRHDGDMQ